MSDDAIPGPTPIHYPDERNPSQNPPGERAPIPVSREDSLRDYNDLFSLMAACRRLWRVSRHPRSDDAFKEMRPQLEDWRYWMEYKLLTFTAYQDAESIFMRNQLHLIEFILGETK